LYDLRLATARAKEHGQSNDNRRSRHSKSCLVAVVQKENFKRFPKLEELKGEEVVFTSKVVESAGRLEVVLVRPGQLKVLR